MGQIEALFQAFDPLRPLEADEDLLYVDWQRRLEPDGADAKSRLAREFVRNATPERPIVRLLTGHKGSGKTTELHRVASQLRDGSRGQKIFVSTLYAQRWLDIEDIEPEDLVLQIVRQLVADLKAAGMRVAEDQFKHGLGTLWEKLRQIRVEKVDVGLDPLTVSFALQDFPTARREFRELLRGQLTTVYDLVNNTLLPAARSFVRDQLGCSDIVLIVDDLDKMSQRTLPDRPATNQEELFLENAATLRAIRCSMLLTIPIELAYSPAQGRLRDEYGASIASVPLIAVTDRNGQPTAAGRPAMVEILGRRASKGFADAADDADASAARLFAEPGLVDEVVRLSGGHVRSLLVMVTALLSRVDELPIGAATFAQCAREETRSLTKGLFPADRAVLAEVAQTQKALEDQRFFALLRNLYVFAYEDDDEDWYGLNPLLPTPTGAA
jgi:hypothetical protein